MTLDTLYINHIFDHVLFRFIDSCSPAEKVQLRKIAIVDKVGQWGNLNKAEKYWKEMGTQLEKLTGLQEILTAHDISRTLVAAASEIEDDEIYPYPVSYPVSDTNLQLRRDVGWKYCVTELGRCVELFDEFPQELAQECQWPEGEDMPVAGSRSKHIGNGDWVDKRTKAVHCWQRAGNPAYY